MTQGAMVLLPPSHRSGLRTAIYTFYKGGEKYRRQGRCRPKGLGKGWGKLGLTTDPDVMD